MPGPRLQLPDVTLAAVTSVAVEATGRAIVRCVEAVDFGAVLWISDVPPPASVAGFTTWRQIAPIQSRSDYSQFMLRGLEPLVDTGHVLNMQWDGYVVDQAAWVPSFLEYDYIGAPWPHFPDQHTVGNGGFSLRSKRLLAAVAALPIDPGEAEDLAICRTWRTHLETRHAIRFAPADLAHAFSRERAPKTRPTFGFHGIFNMIDHVPSREMQRLLNELECTLIPNSELREVLFGALRKGHWATARTAASRLYRSILA